MEKSSPPAAASATKPLQPAAEPSGTLQEVKLELAALETRLGPDAYSQPEIRELLKRLEGIPADSEDAKEAPLLANVIRGKLRAVNQALKDDIRPENRPTPSDYGPRPMQGDAPASREAIHKADNTPVGVTREELLSRYGSCLVRQTWFRGVNGGPTAEFFQTAPECRDRLKPKIYRVANNRVYGVSDGEIDALMKTVRKDDALRR